MRTVINQQTTMEGMERALRSYVEQMLQMRSA